MTNNVQCYNFFVVLPKYNILSISLHNDNRISMFKNMFLKKFGPKGTEQYSAGEN